MDRTRPATSYILGLALALLVLGLATPALAQPFDDGNFEIAFDVGLTDFDSDVADDQGLRVGVRGGYFFSDHFEVELQYWESRGEVDPEIGFSGADVTLSNFFVNGVWNFYPNDNLGLYTLLGVGNSNLEAEFNVPRIVVDDDAFAFQAALGLRVFFADERKMNFRLELSSITEDTFDATSSHLSLTAGLGWRIGAY